MTQLLQDIYSSEEQHPASRRNIASIVNIPGTGIFQEASSRDLDVGFAVGVKDDNNDNDSVLNNYSSKSASLPASVTNQAIAGFQASEEPPSNELNVGLFVDPKNGISYYSPDYAPGNSFIARPNTLPKRYNSASLVHSIAQPNAVITPVAYPVLLNPHQHFPLTNLFNFGRYVTVSPIPNYTENPTNVISEFNGLPYPYQNNLKYILGTAGYSAVTPLQTYSANNEERYSNINNLQQTVYPYQRPYQQPLEAPYNLKSFSEVSDQFHDIFRQKPIPVNSVYSSTYPANYGQFSSAKHYQQFPTESYRKFSQPVVIRHEPEEPQLILDQRGTPLMSGQPYGERQVGTFRLRHDNGYQVSVSQPD
jgi:hypothetical protein